MLRLFTPSNLPDTASPQLQKLLPLLKALVIAQLVRAKQPLACLVLVVDVWQGVLNFAAALLLFLVVLLKNWCICVGFTILALSNTLKCIVAVGSYLCLRQSLTTWFDIVTYLSLLQVPYYLVTIHFVFLTYKELKCTTYTDLMLDKGAEGYSAVNYGATQADLPSFRPFEGEGRRLG